LQDIHLSFRECKLITHEGVEGLFKSFEGFKSLKRMSLDFRECTLLEDEALIRMSSALKDCFTLERLSLNFSWCSLTNKGIKELFPALESLERLTSVDLDFSSCRKVQDEVFREMKNILDELPMLESENLSLKFTENFKVDDRKIKKQ